MLRRNLNLLIVGCVLTVLLIPGCSMFVPTPAPVTISFVHPEDRTGSYTLWAQQFQERYPHVTVELVSRSGLSGGQVLSYDGFVASQFEMAGYVQQQAIVDLSAFLDETEDLDTADFYPLAFQAFASQGRQWALPFGIDMAMIYYNRDVFDRYSTPYPQVGWDWGDFLDCALGTTDPDADVFGYALQLEGEFAIYEPAMMIYQHGGRIFDSLQAPTTVTLDDPLNIEAMEFYASLLFRHHVAPTHEDAQRLGRPYPWRGVWDGRFAMWMSLYSERGGLNWPAPWEMNWGIVPMPRDQSASTLAIADGLFISSASEHPDVVWSWLAFVSQQLPPFQMPARRSVAESVAYEQQVGGDVAAAARAALTEAVLVNPTLLGFDAAMNAMAEAFAAEGSAGADPQG